MGSVSVVVMMFLLLAMGFLRGGLLNLFFSLEIQVSLFPQLCNNLLCSLAL